MKYQTTIYFVRHGQTDKPFNPDELVDAKRQLTEEGQRQAEKIGEYFAEFSPSTIFSSPLLRCKQTSNAIREKIGVYLVQEDRRLIDDYGVDTTEVILEKLDLLMADIVRSYHGRHVVCVTHESIIRRLLTREDVDCLLVPHVGMARLVVADGHVVQATFLHPVDEVQSN